MSVEWILECQERAASHSASARKLVADGRLKKAEWHQKYAAYYSALVRAFLLREARAAFEFFKEQEL